MKALVMIVGFLLVGGMIFGGGDDEGDQPDEADQSEVIGDKYGAQVVCEDFVEQRLKSPSSADFSNANAVNLDGKVWQVTGEVDSENSFGAMIRNQYACKVKFMGDDNWRLQTLTGLEN